MAFDFAGMFGPEAILNGSVTLLPGVQVSVYLVGSSTPATLYSDRLKTSTMSNPVAIDSRGNLTFFADPGQYDIRLLTNGVEGTAVTVNVPVDAGDAVNSGMRGTTAQRPTGLGENDIGYVFFDTTLQALNGLPLMWNGERWIDLTSGSDV